MSEVVELRRPWTDGLLWKTDKEGARVSVRSSSPNLLVIFENHERLRGILGYDEHADDPCLLAAPPWAVPGESRTYPSTLCDEDDTRCGRWLQDEYFTAWNGKTAIHDALVAAAKARPFNPVRSYLESLRWDGIERLEDWLTDYFDAENTTYTRAVGKRWMVSAVARIFNPGEQVDCVLVLEGNEGAGKSSALAILAGAWFKDETLDISQTQETAIALQGVWIYELAELAGLKGKEWERVKAFVTRRSDRYRPKYGRNCITRPRRLVFAASTNDDQYISDERGARRFWPVRCGDEIRLLQLAEVRDQLWAEAVERYRRREKWHLEERSLRLLAAAEIKERMQRDPWEEMLEHWMSQREEVTTGEIIKTVGIKDSDVNRGHEMRAADLARRFGFVKDRRMVGGKRRHVFIRPLFGGHS